MMKYFILSFVILFSIQTSNALEVNYIHLKSGEKINVQSLYFNVPTNEIKALEISNGDQETYLVSPSDFEYFSKLKHDQIEITRFSKMGGEDSGGN